MGLRLQNIYKGWREFELIDINLEINNGEYVVLLGPTGAGKTRLLEVILGFYPLDKGKLFLNGHDITSLPPEQRNFGYLPQNCMLFPHITVRKNIEFGLKMRGIKFADNRETVDQILDLMGLRSLENRVPQSLSGGERQKTALARALVLKPQLLLLDEPMSGIDIETRKILTEELKRIHKEFHLTIIHVTHDQSEAFSLADRIAIIRNGRIVQVGDAKEIFSNPKEAFTARFLGYENVYDAKLIGKDGALSLLDLGGLVVKVAGKVPSDKCTIAIWPEDIVVSKTQNFPNDWNILRGRLEEQAILGSFATITVNVGLYIKTILSKRSFLEIGLLSGEEVWLAFDPVSVKIM
ncbi:MAG: transporter ATP-binding protein [Thermoproteota archaeon]|nr:transporter ATP-binding protein [Thermoproteota archaeon]